MPALAITDQSNPNPAVPGAVDFTDPKAQPGNTTSPKPAIPTQNPPNVTGEQASFSSVTAALADMIKTKTSELSASGDALIANNKVDATAAQQVSNLTEDTIGAMQRVQRIKQMPDEITQILGIFDKDWNIGYQAGRIDINETRAKQISNTAAATKIMNNQLPDLMAKASAASQAIFNAQKEANQLAINQQHADTAQLEARIKQVRLSIDLKQEQRASTEFAVNSMSTAQLEAAMQDFNAKGAKSKFAGIAGHIEHRLTSESAAITALDNANTALKEKKMDVFNKEMTNAASYIPANILGPMIDRAEAKNESVIQLPTGNKGKDGKEIMIPMPIMLAKQGLVQSMTTDIKANEMVSADLTQKKDIIPRVTYLTRTAQAFVGMDPRAANVFVHTSDILKGINSKDPSSIARVDGLLKQQEKVMEGIIKENAEKFSSDTAKAAIIAAGKNGGKFDAIGGTAVAANSVAIPALNVGARYSSAWGLLNMATANEISRQRADFGSVANTADAQSNIALMLAKPNGRESVNTISQKLFADPKRMAPVRDAIKEKITDSALGGVFGQLAQEKNANPVWANLAGAFQRDGLAQFHKPDGRLDVAKLFERMEQATLLAKAQGNKAADFSNTFIQGLQKYTMTVQDQGMNDATYTISDHALEAALFGGDPTPATLANFAGSMRQVQARARQEFQKRVQEDLNGTTQRKAWDDMTKLGQWVPGAGETFTGNPNQIADLAKKTGTNLNAIPSATGTGLTVAQIQQIMAAGQ